MPAGSNGVNHGKIRKSQSDMKVDASSCLGIAVDGNAVLLTVTIQ
jgi:hypothetical protein